LLDKKNIDKLEELLVFLYHEEILQDSRVNLVLGRIQSRIKPTQDSYALPYKDYYSSLFSKYMYSSYMTDSMIDGSEVSILSKIYKSWKNKGISYPHLKGCEAVYPGRFCYYVDGLIYPCTEIAGDSKYAIGSYINGDLFQNSYSQWCKYSISNLPKCLSCKYIGFCKGGCPVTNMEVNHSINDVYCLNIEKSIQRMVTALFDGGFFNE